MLTWIFRKFGYQIMPTHVWNDWYCALQEERDDKQRVISEYTEFIINSGKETAKIHAMVDRVISGRRALIVEIERLTGNKISYSADPEEKTQ